jgi:hypothetical protein
MEENKMRNKFNSIVTASMLVFLVTFSHANAAKNLDNYQEWLLDTLVIPGIDNPQGNYSSPVANKVNDNNQMLTDQDTNGHGSESFVDRIKAKVSASLKIVKTPLDMIKQIIEMFNSGCDGLDGIINCMATGAGMFGTGIDYVDTFKTALNEFKGGQKATQTLPGGTVVSKGTTEGNVVVNGTVSSQTARNAAKVQKTATDVQTSRNTTSLMANDEDVMMLGQVTFERAKDLQDNIDASVSTRAAIQAMGEGLANYMRFSALSHRQVVDRLQGIMQNTAQTNELLSQIVEQTIETQQSQVDLAKARYDAGMNTTEKGVEQWKTQTNTAATKLASGAGNLSSLGQ